MFEPDPESLNVRDLAWKGEIKTPSKPKAFEEEVRQIRTRRGELEDIRRKLGLSKKEMAQLLYVDPSAWTRWTRGVTPAPAHVYRSLDWYLQLREKDPQHQGRLEVKRLQKDVGESHQDLKEQMDHIKSQLASEAWREERLEMLNQIESAQKLSFAWKALLLVTLIIALL